MELKSPTAKAMIVLACLVVVLAGIKAASAIMVPFFLSVFIAIACSPLINWASAHRIPRWASITLVILIILVFGFLLAGLVGQSLTDFKENLPGYRKQLDSEFAWIIDRLATMNIHINRELFTQHFDPGTAMSVATNFLSGMGGALSNMFLILLTVIFMLFEADSMPSRLHTALADPEMKMKHVDRFIKSVNSYLAIKTVVSLATGLIIGIWLYILDIDHFLLWGVLAFLLNYRCHSRGADRTGAIRGGHCRTGRTGIRGGKYRDGKYRGAQIDGAGDGTVYPGRVPFSGILGMAAGQCRNVVIRSADHGCENCAGIP